MPLQNKSEEVVEVDYISEQSYPKMAPITSMLNYSDKSIYEVVNVASEVVFSQKRESMTERDEVVT